MRCEARYSPLSAPLYNTENHVSAQALKRGRVARCDPCHLRLIDAPSCKLGGKGSGWFISFIAFIGLAAPYEAVLTFERKKINSTFGQLRLLEAQLESAPQFLIK